MTLNSSDSTLKDESLEMLFTACWNVPRAAEHCEVTWEEMKQLFNEYCKNNPPRYDQNGEHV